MVYRIATFLLLAYLASAEAAPNIPSSEQPGRERGRFQPSPLDRFTGPGATTAKPVWRWQCKRPKGKRAKHSRNASRRC